MKRWEAADVQNVVGMMFSGSDQLVSLDILTEENKDSSKENNSKNNNN